MNDEGMKELAHFKTLRTLHLFKNAVSDEGLKELAKIKRLKHLRLVETKVTGKGLKNLSGIELEALVLSGPAVTDDGISAIAELN